MTRRTKRIATASVLLAVAGLASLGLARLDPSATNPSAVKRSLPNGRTDVIKAMGNAKWSDIELKR